MTISLAPPAQTIPLELAADETDRLEDERRRLSRDANPPLTWERLVNTCVTIGLERLQRIPAEKAVNLIDGLEG